MPMDWTAQEDRYMAEYRGETTTDAPDPGRCEVCGDALAHVGPDEWECLDCLDAEVAERDAERLVDDACQEAVATAGAVLDFNVPGEEILVRRIAEALHQARRAA